jgi:hypothetical protein
MPCGRKSNMAKNKPITKHYVLEAPVRLEARHADKLERIMEFFGLNRIDTIRRLIDDKKIN